jgi:ribose/xylose/arabinose/galactoside ABC-type transport system permease subunit
MVRSSRDGVNVLSFGVIMALSIAGMLVVMRQRGIDASFVVATAMAFVAVCSAVVLALLLRRLRPS